MVDGVFEADPALAGLRIGVLQLPGKRQPAVAMTRGDALLVASHHALTADPSSDVKLKSMTAFRASDAYPFAQNWLPTIYPTP